MTTCEQLLLMSKDRMGRFGEAICESVMQSSGVTYIPLCKLESGGAPMAVAQEKKTVLPDFDVIGRGVSAYIDAKVKTKSVRFKNTGEVRHGINLSNHEHYAAMGYLANKECGLFIVELQDDSENWSGALLSESFLGLGKPIKGFNEPVPKVYWPRKRFNLIGAFSADELLAIARKELSVDMSSTLVAAFSAPPRRCQSHFDRSTWVDAPDPSRNNWIKTTCAKCGTFIGSRPVK